VREARAPFILPGISKHSVAEYGVHEGVARHPMQGPVQGSSLLPGGSPRELSGQVLSQLAVTALPGRERLLELIAD
jgi:hypothetical protein